MDALLHRIEALPGGQRYAVTFRKPDGSEQTAVVHAADNEVDVAQASLPDGCTRGSEAFSATAAAVIAVERARTVVSPAGLLRDVDGGWDVGLGNIVLSAGDLPTCTAHGELVPASNSVYECAECGAQAEFG